eukprot:239953-Pleurochrysis_carterae.AAC.4
MVIFHALERQGLRRCYYESMKIHGHALLKHVLTVSGKLAAALLSRALTKHAYVDAMTYTASSKIDMLVDSSRMRQLSTCMYELFRGACFYEVSEPAPTQPSQLDRRHDLDLHHTCLHALACHPTIWHSLGVPRQRKGVLARCLPRSLRLN